MAQRVFEGGEAACRPPILEKINRKLPPSADTEEAVARKHNCGSVWCTQGCYRRFHLARHFARLSEMPWEESRMVTLTLDRDKVGSGADAYIWFREQKALGRFFVSLERQGVKVRDWAGQIEFHRDGTPHWHLLIRTQKGKAGMIGHEALAKAWPWGRMIREEYFKDRKHYDNTVGYFGKAGYFHKGKKYQTELPDYFQSPYFKGKRIARFYSARRPSEEKAEPREASPEPELSETIVGKKLQTCGQFVHIWFYADDRGGFPQGELHYSQCLQVAYKDFIAKHPGYYVPGRGYSFYLSGSPPPEIPCPF